MDSSVLLRLALDTLGPDNVLALTVRSCLLPSRELERVASWPARQGLAGKVDHAFIDMDPLAWDEFTANPADRCYHCKNRIYSVLLEDGRRRGMAVLLDGTNHDDLRSDRPGLKALRELGVGIPLAAALLSKQEVRELARRLGLDTWDAPSASCLATRIPQGMAITAKRLNMIATFEEYLVSLGFAGCRVRLDACRADAVTIQVQEQDVSRFAAERLRAGLLDFFSDSGMKKVLLDLEGR